MPQADLAEKNSHRVLSPSISLTPGVGSIQVLTAMPSSGQFVIGTSYPVMLRCLNIWGDPLEDKYIAVSVVAVDGGGPVVLYDDRAATDSQGLAALQVVFLEGSPGSARYKLRFTSEIA